MKKTHNKYKKQLIFNKNLLKKGCFGLKINNFLNFSQEQKARIEFIFLKKLKELKNKKKIKWWTNINCNKTQTKLNLESRMGKGKGSIYTKTTFFRPGHVLFETDEINKEEKKELFKSLKKLFFTKINYVDRYNN